MSSYGRGRHAVLQGLQFPAKGLGQHVGQHADELADLDEQALQLLDGSQDPARVLSMDRLHEFGRGLFAAEAPAHTQPPIGQHHLKGHAIGPQQAAQRPAVHGTATGRLSRVHRRGLRAWGRDTRSILRVFARHGLQHISPLLSAHPPSRVGSRRATLAAYHRGRVWEPSQGSHENRVGSRASYARRVPSREGLGTLSGFP